MPTTASLKGICRVGDALISEQLEANLVSFLEWSLLERGGFTTITLPPSHSTPGPHRLRLSNDSAYTTGRAWEGFRRDWIWETGVAFPAPPIDISGVWVGGNFHSLSSTGTYAHIIDYPNGRVIFDTAIPTGSLVCAEYSYRRHQFTTSDSPWWREVQFQSLEWSDPQFLRQGSGAWSTLNERRMQLPAVVVESAFEASAYGSEMGSLALNYSQAVDLHILAERRTDALWLHDALMLQREKSIWLYEKNLLLAADKWPLDYYGSRRTGALTYPSMTLPSGQGGFQWKKARISRCMSRPSYAPLPLQATTVRWFVDAVLP